MKSLLRLLPLVFVVSVISTTSLSAGQIGYKDPASEPCTSWSADTCFHAGDWWYDSYAGTSGGGYTHILDCGLTESCKACGLGGPYGLRPECVTVKLSASCSCAIDSSLISASGTPLPGFTACSSEGSCTYRGY
jgi:hypothetical protein